MASAIINTVAMRYLLVLLLVTFKPIYSTKEFVSHGSSNSDESRILDVMKRLGIKDISDLETELSDSTFRSPAGQTDTCEPSIDTGTIIRASESIDAGAEFINSVKDVSSNSACYNLCCKNTSCDVAVYQDKSDRYCYLFKCEGKCIFKEHAGYLVNTMRRTAAQPVSQSEDELEDLQGEPPAPQKKKDKGQATGTLPVAGTGAMGSVPKEAVPAPSTTVAAPVGNDRPFITPHTVGLAGYCLEDNNCEDPNAACAHNPCHCQSGFYNKEGLCRKVCPPSNFECFELGTLSRGPECISREQVCDSYLQCADGSDEFNCDAVAANNPQLNSWSRQGQQGWPQYSNSAYRGRGFNPANNNQNPVGGMMDPFTQPVLQQQKQPQQPAIPQHQQQQQQAQAGGWPSTQSQSQQGQGPMPSPAAVNRPSLPVVPNNVRPEQKSGAPVAPLPSMGNNKAHSLPSPSPIPQKPVQPVVPNSDSNSHPSYAQSPNNMQANNINYGNAKTFVNIPQNSNPASNSMNQHDNPNSGPKQVLNQLPVQRVVNRVDPNPQVPNNMPQSPQNVVHKVLPQNVGARRNNYSSNLRPKLPQGPTPAFAEGGQFNPGQPQMVAKPTMKNQPSQVPQKAVFSPPRPSKQGVKSQSNVFHPVNQGGVQNSRLSQPKVQATASGSRQSQGHRNPPVSSKVGNQQQPGATRQKLKPSAPSQSSSNSYNSQGSLPRSQLQSQPDKSYPKSQTWMDPSNYYFSYGAGDSNSQNQAQQPQTVNNPYYDPSQYFAQYPTETLDSLPSSLLDNSASTEDFSQFGGQYLGRQKSYGAPYQNNGPNSGYLGYPDSSYNSRFQQPNRYEFNGEFGTSGYQDPDLYPPVGSPQSYKPSAGLYEDFPGGSNLPKSGSLNKNTGMKSAASSDHKPSGSTSSKHNGKPAEVKPTSSSKSAAVPPVTTHKSSSTEKLPVKDNGKAKVPATSKDTTTPKPSGSAGSGNNHLFMEKVIIASSSSNAEGPIIALSLGLAFTLILLILVGCRLRNMKTRLRKGRPLHSNEADYLINGMYL
ncbi:nuclear receptor coactivator 6 [Aplysia californica]|uniref:Nuclear receptor coactivator 6 n=1 Tax=Aplysia californica TaxID=6500 RepID=A0ABM0JTM7_APLCA|nr:nuclear receptor coactivator 6 [Aplysia californica]